MDQSTLTRDRITEILPHRNSMLLVDEVKDKFIVTYANKACMAGELSAEAEIAIALR